MTTPSAPGSGESGGSGAQSGDPTADAPFDPYRFGLPDHPVPPEYAPPGYTPPPPAPANPYGSPPAPSRSPYPPYGTPPYGNSPYGTPAQGTPAPGNSPAGNPYGSPPYAGAPAPPEHHAYVQPKAGNGKAIAALILGILSIVLFLTSIFDAILVILGLVFGFLGLNEASSARSGGRGLAIAGLICTAVGAVLAIVWTVYIVHAVNQCGGFDQNHSASFNQCVQDHL